MKKNELTILSLFLFTLFFFNSCTKPCGDLPPNLGKSQMIIYPFNVSMDNYFYPKNESLSPYKRDSLKVINENGKLLFISNIT